VPGAQSRTDERVVDTPELRAQYNANLPRITAFWTELSQNEVLYSRFKALAAAPDGRAAGPRSAVPWSSYETQVTLRAGRRRTGSRAEAALQGGIVNGQEAGQHGFAENVPRRHQPPSRCSSSPIVPRSLAVPDDAVQTYREAAEAEGRSGYRDNHAAVSDAIRRFWTMPTTDELRESSIALTSRAPRKMGNLDWNNGPLMVELLAELQEEHARLLGYSSFCRGQLLSEDGTPRRRSTCTSCTTSAGAPGPYLPSATWRSCASLRPGGSDWRRSIPGTSTT